MVLRDTEYEAYVAHILNGFPFDRAKPERIKGSVKQTEGQTKMTDFFINKQIIRHQQIFNDRVSNK